MAKDEQELQQEISDIADMAWAVARFIDGLDSVNNHTPENVQACVDSLYSLGKRLQKLKAPLLMKELPPPPPPVGYKLCCEHNMLSYVFNDGYGIKRIRHYPKLDLCGEWDGVDGNMFHRKK